MVAALIGTVLLVPSPAQAADEWSTAKVMGSTCNVRIRPLSSGMLNVERPARQAPSRDIRTFATTIPQYNQTC